MTYQDLLTELAVIQAFICKVKDDPNNSEELEELKEQEQYLIEKIVEHEK